MEGGQVTLVALRKGRKAKKQKNCLFIPVSEDGRVTLRHVEVKWVREE